MSRRRSLIAAARLALAVVAPGGCAGFQPTGPQAQALEHLAVCEPAGPNAYATEVRHDGSFTLEGRHMPVELVRRCLTERFGYDRYGDPRITVQIREPGD